MNATRQRGWLRANKWLLLRRLSQFGILALFLLGPLAGIWIVKGNLSSSLTLKILPLTDPYVLLQSLAAGHVPFKTALVGALIVAAFYLIAGGRVYCSWVCPVNLITDAASWLRRRLGLKGGHAPDTNTRYWLLAGTLIAAAATHTLVWEWINPVSVMQRSLLFGMGLGGFILLGIFLYDLLLASRGWCGHLCPVGAFYSLLGRYAIPRVSAAKRGDCDDCMDCFKVCPEPQVIRPALKGITSPLINSANCTLCGRCVDVCNRDVFTITHRFNHRSES
jgi:ferredoxin-type protein NapH